MYIKDYNKAGLKSKTAVKSDVKARSIKMVYDLFSKALGEENVSMVRIGCDTESNAVAVVVGTIDDRDGFEQEVCVTIDPVVKPWEDGGEKRLVERFDRFEAAKSYEDYLRSKKNDKKCRAEKERLKEARKRKTVKINEEDK